MDDFLLFLGVTVFGVFAEILIARIYFRFTKRPVKKDDFNVGRYFFLMIAPLFATAILATQAGIVVVKIFAAFALVGAFFEWLIGFSYHMVVGHRLWTYHRLSVNGYTSILSIPLWGFAGALFYFLIKIFV